MNDLFRTTVAPLDMQGTVRHDTPLLLLGSCFAEGVGRRLEASGFDTTVNPFGTLYNPASIAEVCRRLSEEVPFGADDIAGSPDGMMHCWLGHSRLSARLGAKEYMESLDRRLSEAAEAARAARVVVITLGTNHIFTLAGSGAVVANCHKFPAARFVERDLSLEECAAALREAVASLRRLSPGSTVILTVSPVRYPGRGLHASQIAKATLLLACEAVTADTPRTIYFPSYEILNDDLRDYRFYAADMKHPSDTATDYVYSIFAASFFTEATAAAARSAAALRRRSAHHTILTS